LEKEGKSIFFQRIKYQRTVSTVLLPFETLINIDFLGRNPTFPKTKGKGQAASHNGHLGSERFGESDI